MTEPDRTPKTPDLPPPEGARAPDITPIADQDREDRPPTGARTGAPADAPAPGRDRPAAETTEAQAEDEPPD
ncbi:hypothetical protein [Kitasatospora phosalacinea]|uniref:hypothetical protein n=1 Tax=Kitasatospora phosalacinea TaxID=2065 RepID=UPI000523F240|nr:hypothetical protein [Kitasatospora phosalacinea]